MQERKYKIILIGDSNVGKTCFLMRYVNNTFTQNHMATIGVDVKSKVIKSSIGDVELQIWDTAGQEKFRSLSPSYLRSADGVLLLYDITNRPSFENMITWLEAVDKYSKKEKEVIIVGNKSDLESLRKVSFDEGQELSKKQGYLFIESSAKEGVGVDFGFSQLVERLIVNRRNNNQSSSCKISNSKGVQLTKGNRNSNNKNLFDNKIKCNCKI